MASAAVLEDDGAHGEDKAAVEWEARCQLAVAYRVANLYHWDLVVFNHITLKVPGSDDAPGGPFFLINPFGLRFDEVTASSLLKVDIDGNVVDPGTSTGILFKNGYVVHSAIHLARPELHAAVHCHHEDATAVSMTKDGLLPMNQESLGHYGKIAYHPFEGAATDPNERGRMAKSLGPTMKTMILENHGPLCAGETLAEAMSDMYTLTRACTYQVRALSLVGGDKSRLNLPSAAEVTAQQARFVKKLDDKVANSYDGSKMMWAAWVRQVEAMYGAENIYK